MLPVFRNPLNHAQPLALRYSRFSKVASLIHEGTQLLAGHYRAVLHDSQHGDLLTNDSVPAQRVQPHNIGHCQSNNYAFIIRHCPEMP